MTNAEKREQWRFYFAVYFTDQTASSPWAKGIEVVLARAAEFADFCVGEEEKRFADLRPDPPPVQQPGKHEGPYR